MNGLKRFKESHLKPMVLKVYIFMLDKIFACFKMELTVGFVVLNFYCSKFLYKNFAGNLIDYMTIYHTGDFADY